MPASTARRLPLVQEEERERTRKAVVFDSRGPPPEPCEALVEDHSRSRCRALST